MKTVVIVVAVSLFGAALAVHCGNLLAEHGRRDGAEFDE